jgi:hypothetical protein
MTGENESMLNIPVARRNMCLDSDQRDRSRVRSMTLLQSSISLVMLLLLQKTTCCRAWTTSTVSCWRTSTAFARNTVIFSSPDDSLPDDEGMDMMDPREMQESMNDLFSIKKKEPINQDPAGGYTLTDLEDYFSQRTPGSKSPARPIPKLNATLEESFPQGGEDGMYLDPDLYVKSSQWLNPDGSLNFPDDEERLKPGQTGPDYQRILKAIVQPAPNSPDSVAPSLGGIENMEDVWQALQQQASTTTNNPDHTATSEELHRQVFAEEQGYLNQSQIFREALTDSTKAAEAATLRHGQQFRQRQAEAIASLDEQIKEWEEGWEENYTQAQHCSKCECILAHDEIDMSRKHRGLCQVCYGELLVAKSKINSPPSPPVPRQPVLRRLKTGGTFRPRQTEPVVTDAEIVPVQRSEPKKEMDPVESFRRDRALETLAPEQPTGLPSERAERTAGVSQSPPGVSYDPTKPPRNWPQRPVRPTRPPDPIPVDPVPQNDDSNENSVASPAARQAEASQPPLPFFAAKTKAPTPSKETNDANAVDDER